MIANPQERLADSRYLLHLADLPVIKVKVIKVKVIKVIKDFHFSLFDNTLALF